MKNPIPRPKTVTPTRSIRIPLARTTSRTGSQVASSPRAAIQVFVSRMEAFLGTELFGSDKPITVGRHADADMRLVGDTVSRRHCLLTLEGRRVYLQDLGSANGTLVNRKRIRGRVEVRPNDTIQIGAFTLKVRPLIPVPARARQESGISDATTRIEAVLSAEGSKGTEESPLDLGALDLGERKDWRLYEQAVRRQGGEVARSTSVPPPAAAPRTPSRAHAGPEETPVTEEMEERSPTSRGTHARRVEERLEPTRRAVELDTRAQARIAELDKLMKRIDSEAHPAGSLEVEEDSGESIWCEVPESFAAKLAAPIEEIPSCSEIIELAPDLASMGDSTFTDFLARELGRAAGLDEAAPPPAPAALRSRTAAAPNPFAIVPNQDIPDTEDSGAGGTTLSESDVAMVRAASRAEMPIDPVADRAPSAVPSSPIGETTEVTDGPEGTTPAASPLVEALEDDATEPSLAEEPSVAGDLRPRLSIPSDEVLSREAAALLALAAAEAMQQPSPRAAVAQSPASTPKPAAAAAVPSQELASEEPSTVRPSRSRSVLASEIPAAAAARAAAAERPARAALAPVPTAPTSVPARASAAPAAPVAPAAVAHSEAELRASAPRVVARRGTLSPVAPSQPALKTPADPASLPSIRARSIAPSRTGSIAAPPPARTPAIEGSAHELAAPISQLMSGECIPESPAPARQDPRASAAAPSGAAPVRATSRATPPAVSAAAPAPAPAPARATSRATPPAVSAAAPAPVAAQEASAERPQGGLRGGSQAALRAQLAQDPATTRVPTGKPEVQLPPPAASTEQVRPRSIPRAPETQRATPAAPLPAQNEKAVAQKAAPAYTRPSAPSPAGMEPETRRSSGAIPAAAVPVPTSVATAPKTGLRSRPVQARLVTPTPLRINVSPIAAEVREERRAAVERVHSGAPGTGVAPSPMPSAPIPSEEVTGEATEELTAEDETFSAIEIAARAGDKLLDVATLRHTGEQYILGHRTPQGTIAPHGEHSGLRLLRITESREVDLVFPREVGGHLMRDNETVMFHELGRGRKYSCLRLKPRDVATVILGEGPGRVSYHVRVIRAPRFQR